MSAVLSHQLHIKSGIHTVYEAVSTAAGIGSWWDIASVVLSGDDNTILEFRPGKEEIHGVLRMKVIRTIDDRLVEWECISQHQKISPASAWYGTHIVFQLNESEGTDGVTILDFRHTGWDETNEYIDFCNEQWGVALNKLKAYCESQSH
jgi:hypothetical protein